MVNNSKLKIVDTTLRDGEQTPGIAFSLKEKIKIAEYLDMVGVDFIEVGTPAAGPEEQKAIERIINLHLDATIITWNRALITDIQKSVECGSRYIHISLPVSDIQINHKIQKDKKWVLNTLEKVGSYIQREGLTFSVGAEDASRATPDFLAKYGRIAKEIGAVRLRLCDTVGILNPFICYKWIKNFVDVLDMDIEIHAHNDFGMATANTLAGVKAGATCMDTTIIGIGERAGNAALEEIVMALKYTMGFELNVDTSLFREIAQFIARCIGRDLPLWKSIVGTYVFAHESGIHVDGVLKNPATYEPFSPDEVGNARKLLIGKHSGKHSIIERFRELGINIDDGQSVRLLQEIKKNAVFIKGPVPDGELMRIYEDEVSRNRTAKMA